jgi:hypothetical protein
MSGTCFSASAQVAQETPSPHRHGLWIVSQYLMCRRADRREKRFINTDLGDRMRAPESFHARYGAEPLRGLALADSVRPACTSHARRD